MQKTLVKIIYVSFYVTFLLPFPTLHLKIVGKKPRFNIPLTSKANRHSFSYFPSNLPNQYPIPARLRPVPCPLES